MHAPRVVTDDIFSLPLVHGVALDPSGTRVAFAVTTMNADDDGYAGSIRVANLDGGAVRTYTRGTARDAQPRFSPSGERLYFLSDRGGRRQVWLIDADGGEPYPTPAVPGDVAAAAMSPSGRRIAVVATNDVHRREIARRGWRRIDRIRYRADGIGYLDDLPQLWLIDLDAGTSRALTDGTGSVAAPAWSPDETRIAYAAEHRPEADSLWHTELWVVDAAEPGRPRTLCTLGGAVETPSWSPDGKQIAFLGFADPKGYAIAPLRLYAVAADGTAARCLTDGSPWICGNHVLNDLESSSTVSTPAWSMDGSLFVLGTEHGSTGVYRVDADARAQRVTPRSHTISEFSLARGRIAACASDTSTPPEVYVTDAGGEGWRRLTTATKAWCDPRRFAVAERFVADARGGPIDVWYMRGDGPAPRPTILQIHGGPHASYGDAFFFEFQLLAAAGFDVVYSNPRGSQGYGDAFASAITGDWAAPAYDDCIDALDAACKRGDIDAARLGVAGGSYGGYLTAWTVGHTDRFAAAIAMRPAIDLASLWGASEVGRMLEAELGCRPLDDPEIYRRDSPLTYADAVKTPLLLMHSEHDFRCPIGESEKMFTALKSRGAVVEFLRFGEADHGLSRGGPPRLRAARLSAIVDWFARYLTGTRPSPI